MKNKPQSEEVQNKPQDDMFLEPLSPDGKILRDTMTGAVFTLSRSLLDGSMIMKRHNNGNSFGKPRN